MTLVEFEPAWRSRKGGMPVGSIVLIRTTTGTKQVMIQRFYFWNPNQIDVMDQNGFQYTIPSGCIIAVWSRHGRKVKI